MYLVDVGYVSPIRRVPETDRSLVMAVFIAIGQQVWGKGKTAEEAKKQMAKIDGRMPKVYYVKVVGDDGAGVGGDGSIIYNPKMGRPKFVEYRKHGARKPVVLPEPAESI